jgi:hypothetical protein
MEDGITRACLDNMQVMKAIGDGDKDMDQRGMTLPSTLSRWVDTMLSG